jgi:hypothetical protein
MSARHFGPRTSISARETSPSVMGREARTIQRCSPGASFTQTLQATPRKTRRGAGLRGRRKIGGISRHNGRRGPSVARSHPRPTSSCCVVSRPTDPRSSAPACQSDRVRTLRNELWALGPGDIWFKCQLFDSDTSDNYISHYKKPASPRAGQT